MGKQSKPPKIAFPNPIFQDLAEGAEGTHPIVPTGVHSIDTLTETTMFLRHIHCIHTPASISFTDDHPRYSSYAHVLEPAARPNSGQKCVVSALLAQAGMHLARGQHFSNLRTTMPKTASKDVAHA